MSSRQARRERREAERKARKAEMKRMKAAPHTPSPAPADAPERSRDHRERLPMIAAPLPEFPEAKPAGFVSQLQEPKHDKPNPSAQTRRAINRANAQHSTGPRSISGKLASSRNSLQHGLASGALIILGENPAEFEQLTAALLEEHQPAGETEALLVHEMARSWWLTQRAIRLQNECFTASDIDEKRLALLLRYQTTHERAFHKALNTLVKLKRTRDREAIQNRTPTVREGNGFVSQNSLRPAAKIGFASQNPAAGPPNPPPTLAEAA